MSPASGRRGAERREAILRVAADLASVDGLEGLTIGTLAEALGMSKSGLFAHFGSKEELQIATIEVARKIYVSEVMVPALTAPPGLLRLVAFCEAFLSYIEREVFPGGCFFAGAMAEYNSKEGAIRDQISGVQREWMGSLERCACKAVERQELHAQTDAAQLAFELEGALLSANWYSRLFVDATYIARARVAVRTRLLREATHAGRALLLAA
ncbi:MAG: TetR/AcrR family transcriptional regulator [Acidimicrobiales bacterium]